jgi:hypothetical protein
VFFRLAATAGALLIGTLTACSSHDAGTAPSALNIVGTWTQGARLQDTVNHQTHIHTGYFSFSQEGDGFIGTGQQTGLCHSASGDYEGPLATGALFNITNGVQQGSNVSFNSELCAYSGVMSADGSRIEGTARCVYTDQGVPFLWIGDRLADRER